MTCDEFKRINRAGVDAILRLTRAERSAAAEHWAKCFECRDWTMGINLAMTPGQMVEVESRKCEDRADPETFKLDPAEAEKFDRDEPTKEPRTSDATDD